MFQLAESATGRLLIFAYCNKIAIVKIYFKTGALQLSSYSRWLQTVLCQFERWIYEIPVESSFLTSPTAYIAAKQTGARARSRRVNNKRTAD